MGDFAENADDALLSAIERGYEERLDKLREQTERAKRQKAESERAYKRVLADLDKVQDRLDFVLSMSEAIKDPSPWKKRKGKQSSRQAVVHSFLSDTHWGEVVKPEEIGGMNAYNSEIAKRRLRVVGDKTVDLAEMITLDYEGAEVWLGGDMFSGVIHRELEMTNDSTIEDALVEWTEELVRYLRHMADTFGKVHVACMVGNHGRHANDRRMPGKRVALNNADWMLYRNVHMVLKADKRFTWDLARGHDTTVEVYGTRYLLHHGYGFRGGSGISGALSPLMLGQHRATRQQAYAGKQFDWLCVGHFHQYLVGKHLIMNGTLKGYDEHAYKERYEPEDPSQSFWVTTPEHGLAFANAIYPADREAEGW